MVNHDVHAVHQVDQDVAHQVIMFPGRLYQELMLKVLAFIIGHIVGYLGLTSFFIHQLLLMASFPWQLLEAFLLVQDKTKMESNTDFTQL